MPRLIRKCPPGMPVHVIQRGNDRQMCFASDSDLKAYANWLWEASIRFGVSIDAWVFMTNQKRGQSPFFTASKNWDWWVSMAVAHGQRQHGYGWHFLPPEAVRSRRKRALTPFLHVSLKTPPGLATPIRVFRSAAWMLPLKRVSGLVGIFTLSVYSGLARYFRNRNIRSNCNRPDARRDDSTAR